MEWATLVVENDVLTDNNVKIARAGHTYSLRAPIVKVGRQPQASDDSTQVIVLDGGMNLISSEHFVITKPETGSVSILPLVYL